MNDLEINEALALAIGHHRVDVCISTFSDNLVVLDKSDYKWRIFDYRNWNVISPIAERYNCFPFINDGGGWDARVFVEHTREWHYGDTPQKAIALAVIESVGKGPTA